MDTAPLGPRAMDQICLQRLWGLDRELHVGRDGPVDRHFSVLSKMTYPHVHTGLS